MIAVTHVVQTLPHAGGPHAQGGLQGCVHVHLHTRHFISGDANCDILSIVNSDERPSARLKPAVFRDGDQWCALYGLDLQSGVAGFGDTEELALIDFDARWIWERGRERAKRS
jgi:hypothetical protein